jgi:hypothetical protein
MEVQPPHLPPLNTAVHRLEGSMIILSGSVPGGRECQGPHGSSQGLEKRLAQGNLLTSGHGP